VPKEISRNVRFRLELLKEAAYDRDAQHVLRQWCSEDPLFWLNAFVWSLDTRKVGGRSANTSTPFVSYKCQDDAFLTIYKAIFPDAHDRQWKVLIEKTRDMGATWLCAMAFLHAWLFHPDRLTFLCVSYKEEKVDGGDDSIFGKIEFALRHLPAWMLPKGFIFEDHRTKLSLVNPETGTEIKGASTTSKTGVAGRYTSMFFDEFPLFGPNDRTIYMKTADCSNARIFNGTPNGTHTQFYEMTKWGEAEGFKKVRLHWTQHHEKSRGLWRWDTKTRRAVAIDKKNIPEGYLFDNPIVREKGSMGSVWYDRECRERGYNKQAIAQELDIDYFSAGEAFFSHEELMRLIDSYCTVPLHTGVFKDGEFFDDRGGNLRLWIRMPRGGRPARGKYGIGCDVAGGTEGKYSTASCASITDLDTGEKVGEFSSGKLYPEQFANVVANLAEWFHNAIVVWESNGPGATFRKELMEIRRYHNVYLRKRGGNNIVTKLTMEAGWAPAPQEQQELMESYRAALSSGKFLNRSAPALEELHHFVYDGRGVSHVRQLVTDSHAVARANHGDLGWADALSWLLVREGNGAVMQQDQLQKQAQQKAPVGSPAWWRDQDEKERDDSDGWAVE
jgi:hypothetical protein